MGKIKGLVKSARLFFEIVGIIQAILTLAGGTMTVASILTLTKDIPIIIPILLFVLGLGLLVIVMFKTIYRFKVWNSLKVIPELEDVLKKALDIHIHITELQKSIIGENKKQNIKTKVRVQLAEKYFETLKIPKNKLPEYFNSDGTIKKKLYRRMVKINHLKDGEYFTILPLLKDYGRLLNKSKLGLRDSVKNSNSYDQLHNKFMESQLKLNVPDRIMDDINNLPELSYGMNSLSIGINLINENRSWYKYIPDSYIKEKEESDIVVDKVFLRTSMWVKNKVRKAIFNNEV